MSTTANKIKKVERPNLEKHKAELEVIKKTIDDLIKRRNILSNKFDREANDKQNAERNELRKKLDEIRIEQGKVKKERQETLNKIKELQALKRKKNDELRNAKQRLPVSNVKDIDSQISQLESQIEAGVTVNEEKQLLKEISKLKQAKNTLDKVEKSASELNVDEKINALNAEMKKLNEKRVPLEKDYSDIKTKLDVIEKRRRDQSADFKSTKEERAKIQEQIEANIQKRRELNEAFQKQREDFRNYVKAERERREEQRKKEIEEKRNERLQKRFEVELENAEIPAFTEEINSCNTLIGILNNQLEKKSDNAADNSQKDSTNLDASVPEGAVLLNSKNEREEEVFFSGKGKKNKKQHNKNKDAKNAPIKFDLGVMEAFWKLKIDVPSSIEEVQETIKTLEAKRDDYQKNSAEQTKKNKEEALRKMEEHRKKIEAGENVDDDVEDIDEDDE